MSLPAGEGFAGAYRIDSEQNLRNPAGELRYTLNTLLGLKRIRDLGVAFPWDLEEICSRFFGLVDEPYVDPANTGMMLWVGGDLGLNLPDSVLKKVRKFRDEPDSWASWTAQDFGWMISGLVAQGNKDSIVMAGELATYVIERLYVERTGLFRYSASGMRRNLSSFGGVCYLTLAMLQYGRVGHAPRFEEAGLTAVAKLLELQGPMGQWPWMINVASGKVADWYQVYSVHQDSMAPLFLTYALDHFGFDDAREGITKSFGWVLGNNETGQSMISPKHAMIFRSLVRRAKFEKPDRLLRMMRSRIFGYSDSTLVGTRVLVNRECRSYHLGWILYVFAGRTDFEEITNHEDFGVRVGTT
jgi:hypothetical protein